MAKMTTTKVITIMRERDERGRGRETDTGDGAGRARVYGRVDVLRPRWWAQGAARMAPRAVSVGLDPQGHVRALPW